MLRTAVKFSLLAGMLLAAPVGAMPVDGAAVAAMPPPPGPYLSSRPQLELPERAPRNETRLPFVGTMPSMPMRTMPTPNQFPAPPAWWRGPMGH